MNGELISSYQRYLKLDRNYTANTIEAYIHDLDWLRRYMDAQGKRPEEMKLADLENFAASLHEYGIGPTSQGRILSGVRSFFKIGRAHV